MKNWARRGMALTCITSLSLCVLTFSPNALAQGEKTPKKSPMIADVQQLQEVVVTATRRDSSIMDVPFSVNVQSEQDVQRLNTFNLEDLSRNVAGLAIQNLGPGQSVVNIRGVSSGQIVRDQPGVKEQVGIYLDDTPISLSLFTPDIDLYDVSRVETLRGPQGTLFGSGSIGGTVRYITNQPQLNVNEAKAQLDLNTIDGGSNGGHFKTAFNAPVGEKAAVRVVTYGTQYPGFIDALREGGGGVNNDVNDGDRWGGRIAFLWQPTSNLSVTPRVLYQNIDMGGFNREEFFNLFANPHSSNTLRPGQLGRRQQFLLLNETFEDDTMILDNVIKWNFDNLLEATYVVSYTKRDLLVSRDASALTGSVGIFPLAGLGFPEDKVSLPSNLRDTTDVEQMTHEIRFSSNSKSAFQWLAGVFYSEINRAYSQRLPTPGWDEVGGSIIGRLDIFGNGFDTTDSPYVSDLTYDLRQVAVFGEATYTFFDRLGLTAGVRWYDWKEDKTFKSGGIFSNYIEDDPRGQNQRVTVSSDGFAPRFMVSYDVTDHVAVNAQASRGFRLGGVNDPLNQILCNAGGIGTYDTYSVYQRFKDETLWNYEVGVKSSFKKVTLNGSFFYIDIDNLGVNVDAGACSSRVTISVPEAHTLGGELELSVQPMDSLLVTFAGSYVQAEFDSTIINSATGEVIDGIKDGNRIPSVPDWQLSASATYALPGILRANESYVSTSWQFVGDRITQSGDQENTKFPALQSFAGLTLSDRRDLNFRDKMNLDAYHLLNLSTGLVYDSWEFMFYVRNVADENPKLSFDRERDGLARLAYRVGQPRTFGLLTRIYF